MKLFVGLGNPGENHSKNRHNIGFMVVDAIVNRYGGTPWKKKFQGLVSEVTLNRGKLIFLKPSTFMNLSGQSVIDASRFFKLPSTEVCVFHDELDLSFLKIKTKIGGGHAGHNGLRSIQQHLGPDYFRVRLGIGHPGDKAKVASYVLSNFPKNSEADLSFLLEAVAEGFPQLQEGNQEKFLNIVSGQIEEEISQLESDEAQMFLEEMKLSEAGLDRLIRAGYDLLNLETYFTAGPKESRAWTIKKGTKAPVAAGVIHGDFERGFIRAETISYKDYIAFEGESGAKEAGKMRIEGKAYVVEDGDVMHFLFNT